MQGIYWDNKLQVLTKTIVTNGLWAYISSKSLVPSYKYYVILQLKLTALMPIQVCPLSSLHMHD